LQPNIIPELTEVWYFVRDRTMQLAKQTKTKSSTSLRRSADDRTTVDITIRRVRWPQLSNKALSLVVQRNSMPSACRRGPTRKNLREGFAKGAHVKEVGL